MGHFTMYRLIMMNSITPKFAATAALFFLALPLTSQAQTVTWGTPRPSSQQFFQSDGVSTLNGFTLELGYFDTGYTPVGHDPTEWVGGASPWNPLATQTMNSAAPFGAQNTYNNVDHSLAGKELWYWVYNDKGLMGTAAGQTLMVRGSTWLMLDSVPPGLPSAATFTTSSATTVAWGNVDPDRTGPLTSITGGGFMTSARADNTFNLQTASWNVVPVPEPGSAALAALGALGLLRRKRK
jgi:MYXO-CTERM domain-containing protein